MAAIVKHTIIASARASRHQPVDTLTATAAAITVVTAIVRTAITVVDSRDPFTEYSSA